MGRRRQALKAFAKGASMGIGYTTAGAKIGLLCGGPPGALIGCITGYAVALVVALIEDDAVNEFGEAAQKVEGVTSLFGDLNKFN